jgi:hypothetical protein
MTILVSFAIVFVGLYLYYTINDVRKMAVDLKKVTQELNALTTTVTSISKDLLEIQKTNGDVSKMFNMNDMLAKELNGLFKVTEENRETQGEEAQDGDDDDTSSVDTSDIKKVLNDDVESEIEEEEIVVVERTVDSE